MKSIYQMDFATFVKTQRPDFDQFRLNEFYHVIARNKIMLADDQFFRWLGYAGSHHSYRKNSFVNMAKKAFRTEFQFTRKEYIALRSTHRGRYLPPSTNHQSRYQWIVLDRYQLKQILRTQRRRDKTIYCSELEQLIAEYEDDHSKQSAIAAASNR